MRASIHDTALGLNPSLIPKGLRRFFRREVFPGGGLNPSLIPKGFAEWATAGRPSGPDAMIESVGASRARPWRPMCCEPYQTI